MQRSWAPRTEYAWWRPLPVSRPHGPRGAVVSPGDSHSLTHTSSDVTKDYEPRPQLHYSHQHSFMSTAPYLLYLSFIYHLYYFVLRLFTILFMFRPYLDTFVYVLASANQERPRVEPPLSMTGQSQSPLVLVHVNTYCYSSLFIYLFIYYGRYISHVAIS